MCGGGADEWEGGSIFKLLNVCETAPVILHSQLHTYTHLCSERERERDPQVNTVDEHCHFILIEHHAVELVWIEGF